MHNGELQEMTNQEPFLLRFKTETTTSKTKGMENAEYDPTSDMTMVIQNGIKKVAIDTNYRMGTKKADIETGEDQKDSKMWR